MIIYLRILGPKDLLPSAIFFFFVDNVPTAMVPNKNSIKLRY